MGTPGFAVPTLSAILQAGHEVSAVVTAPDRPAGRGQKLQVSPVKEFALAQQIPVLQPEKLRDPAFHDQLRAANPDLMVVVAFRMLPEVVWSMPPMGSINLHASLLPDFRGAAPINWAIIHGETRTGATTFLLNKEIDTGNILCQRGLDILPHWTAGELHDALMDLGAELVVETLAGLENGSLQARPQPENGRSRPAPKIFKEDGVIRWDQPAERVHNHIRGLSPIPTAWTMWEGQPIKIFLSSLTSVSSQGHPPGSLSRLETDSQLFVACADEWLEILSLQLPSKKRLPTSAFLRGFSGTLSLFS